jgi:hypothetical protein
MSPKDIIQLIFSVLQKYLSRKDFTGKLIFTVHCREGKAGKCTSDVQENYFNKKENKACPDVCP